MDIDITIFFQLGFFLLILFGATQVLFKPFLSVHREREQKMQGAADRVALLEREAVDDKEDYLASIREAQAKAQTAREERLSTARSDEKKLLSEVRDEIAQAVGGARDVLRGEEDVAKKTLSTDTDDMAKLLVEKLLGRKVA